MNRHLYILCVSILLTGFISPVRAKDDILLDLKAAEAATEAASLKGGDPLPLSPPFSPKKTLERVQTYLNSFSSFYAKFRQEDPDGTIRIGTVHVERPGKMRLDYTTPTHLLVISDGSWISYDDQDLEQVSYVPLSSTPAAFILGEKIEFSSALVDKVEFSQEDEILITLRNKADPEQGTLILTFKENPLRFTGWQVIDQTTQTTVVSFHNFEAGVAPPAGSFDLSNPPHS